MADRYVVIGLARSRSRWFGEVARWANAAAAPVDFVKCLTSEEARAVLGAGRRVSALLLDTELSRFDRDLVADAARDGVPTLLVGSADRRDWEALGCATRLDADFTRDELVDALDRFARAVAGDDEPTSARVDLSSDPVAGTLIGVLGAGGAGTSTIAMALAQAWAATGADTVLVDGCRRGDLAMYHDVGDVIPGLPELVELHRGDEADPDEIRALEFETRRGYRLVLGLRRARDWAGMRSRAVAAAVHGLQRTHEVSVLDLDDDLETEAETGSADIEDRHALSLAVARRADAVVVVAGADLKGIHDASRLAHDLHRCGTPTERIVVVVNRAPRSTVARAQLARSVRALTDDLGDDGIGAALTVRRHRLEATHHDATALPEGIGCAVLSATRGVIGAGAARPTADPVRIRVGELGTRPESEPVTFHGGRP